MKTYEFNNSQVNFESVENYQSNFHFFDFNQIISIHICQSYCSERTMLMSSHLET